MGICLVTGSNPLLLQIFKSKGSLLCTQELFSCFSSLFPLIFSGTTLMSVPRLVAVGAPRAFTNLKESMVLYSPESSLVKVLLSLHAGGTLHLCRTLTPGLPSTSVYVPLLTTAVMRSYSSDPA